MYIAYKILRIFYVNYGSLLFDSRLLDEHIFVHDWNKTRKQNTNL